MCFVWPPTWRPCTRTASIWASSWTGSTSFSRPPPSRSPRQSPGTRGWRPPPPPRSCGTCSSCSRHMNLQGPIDSEFWYRYIQHPIFGDFLVKNCAFYKNCADCCDIDAKIVLCIVSKSTVYQISSLIPTSICKTIAVRMEVLFKNTFRKKSGLLMSRLISTDVSTAIIDSGPVNLSGIIAGTLAGSSVNVGSHIP